MNTLPTQFAVMPDMEASARINAEVMRRISRARLGRARLHLVLHGAVALLAAVAFVPVMNLLLGEAAGSGFSAYLSLVMSDWSAAFANLGSLIMSMAESAPLAGTILTVALVTILVNSLQRGMRFMSSISPAVRQRAVS